MVPKVEGMRGEVRRQLGLEEVQEIGVVAVSKDFPKVGIRQGGDAGELEFEHVVLAGVHVDAVDAVEEKMWVEEKQVRRSPRQCTADSNVDPPSNPLQRILQRITPPTRNNHNPIVGSEIHNLQILPRIFPCKRVDVGRETGNAGRVKRLAPFDALSVYVVFRDKPEVEMRDFFLVFGVRVERTSGHHTRRVGSKRLRVLLGPNKHLDAALEPFDVDVFGSCVGCCGGKLEVGEGQRVGAGEEGLFEVEDAVAAGADPDVVGDADHCGFGTTFQRVSEPI